jgi:hypothetical protein
LYQLFDLLLVFTGIVAALLVVYLFRKSADKFIYASVAFESSTESMLFVINRVPTLPGNDQLTYRIIRYTAMAAVIFLATMVASLCGLSPEKKKPMSRWVAPH